MDKLMAFWIGIVFISGCESPQYLNKQITDFTVKDTLIILEAKSDFSYHFPEKFSFEVQRLSDSAIPKLRLIFENHYHSTKKRDLLTVPLAGIAAEGIFIFYAKNIPLDNSVQVVELQIMH